MQIEEIYFTDETATRVAVAFTRGGATLSGNWEWPIRDEGKAEAVNAFLAAQVPPLAKPQVKPEPELTRADINVERDRRNFLDFTFNGVVYEADRISQDRLNRARTSALAAIANGAVVGDYRWHGVAEDFVWIAKDNSQHLMDAQTTLAFGNAMVAREGLLIVKAAALKAALEDDQDATVTGQTDITDNAIWAV